MDKTVKSVVMVVVFMLSIIGTAIATHYFGGNRISSLTTENDWQDYDKLMMKGMVEYSLALGNKGYAESDYDDASLFYEDPELAFSWAESYASSADVYYVYASDSYRGAKAYFNQAKNTAPSDKTFQLAELYVSVCDLGADIMDEMHQACEYFSSTCRYYGNEWWDMGDAELEKMNEHISNHDDLIPDFNDYVSDIDALLETF